MPAEPSVGALAGRLADHYCASASRHVGPALMLARCLFRTETAPQLCVFTNVFTHRTTEYTTSANSQHAPAPRRKRQSAIPSPLSRERPWHFDRPSLFRRRPARLLSKSQSIFAGCCRLTTASGRAMSYLVFDVEGPSFNVPPGRPNRAKRAAPRQRPFSFAWVKARVRRVACCCRSLERFARFTKDKGRPRGAALIQAPGKGPRSSK
jgi:hypothetical protein